MKFFSFLIRALEGAVGAAATAWDSIMVLYRSARKIWRASRSLPAAARFTAKVITLLALLFGLLGGYPHVSVTPQQQPGTLDPTQTIFVLANDGLLPIFDGHIDFALGDLDSSPSATDTGSCSHWKIDKDFTSMRAASLSFEEIEPGDRQSFQLRQVFDNGSGDASASADLAFAIEYYGLPLHLWRRTTIRHFVTFHAANGAVYWLECANGKMLGL